MHYILMTLFLFIFVLLYFRSCNLVEAVRELNETIKTLIKNKKEENKMKRLIVCIALAISLFVSGGTFAADTLNGAGATFP